MKAPEQLHIAKSPDPGGGGGGGGVGSYKQTILALQIDIVKSAWHQKRTHTAKFRLSL